MCSSDLEEQIQERLKNAEEDLLFFEKRKDLFDHFMVNEHLAGVIHIVEQCIRGLPRFAHEPISAS